MQPPKLPLKFLRWFCRQEQIDEVEGDLIELFEMRYAQSGKKANWRFAWDVIRSFRATNVKKLKLLNMSNGLLKNTVTTGFRQMSRNKAFTAINLAGLSLSLIAFFMISLFVFDEVSYDRFHANYDRIYRVLKTDTLNTYRAGNTPPALAEKLLSDYPEMKSFSRVYSVNKIDINYEGSELSMRGYIADSSFFNLFTFPVISGQRINPMPDRNSVVLTERAAQLYFKEKEAVGQAISFNGENFVVSAVVTTPPHHSHLQFDYILPMKGIWPDQVFSNWNQSFVTTYFLVDTPDIQATKNKIAKLLMEKNDAYVNTHVSLQPLSEIHLDPEVNFNLTPAGNGFYIQLLLLAGIVILFIAGINFMNLNLARATHRVKEIGIRKLIGAQRRIISLQFMGETGLIIGIAFIISIIGFVLLLPYFNLLSGKSFDLIQLYQQLPLLESGVIALLAVIGLLILSGFYPALAMSSIAPIELIKGWVSRRIGNVSVGRILTTLQFAISMLLLICSIIAMAQLRFIQNKPLGWDQNNLINIPLRVGMFEDFEIFKTELLQQNSIEQVTWVSELPVNVGTGGTISFENMNPEKHYAAYYINAGMDFYKTFKMQSVGEYPLPEIIDESKSNYVVNEALLKMMQEEWGPDVSPIGKELDGGIIVGVVKDFHWQPMTKEIGPILYGLEAQDSYGRPGSMVVRIADGQLKAGLDALEAVHQKLYPNRNLKFDFVDEKIAALYETETNTASLLSYFAGFTIFISCLGLLGLAYHAVSTRIKSLSIRKVLGASLLHLFSQFSREFGAYVLLAGLLSFPLAYWMMQEWLESFAYHITIRWEYFAFTLVGMLALVMSIVGLQFFKVASLNPAYTLRNE